MVKLDTLHGLLDLLSLAGLFCFLFSAIYLAGIKPTKHLKEQWQKTRKRFSGLNFAWPGAAARTRRLGINCAVLIMGMVIGWQWRDHQYRKNYAAEYAAWKQRSEEYKRIYTAWLRKHPELTEPSSGALQ